MGRIHVLSDDVANKIAAGEVVERPASVVKELLENSLDAGAVQVRVEVAGGGRQLVRIGDDGHGMGRDDAMLAFERHATSKLNNARDLLSIATLGFRGEALPSIASVSRLTLETRAPAEASGTLVEIAGGKMLRCEDAAFPRGTQITVRDLFYNVPARRKFLRSEQTELAHIASLVTHYSLAHFDKDFSLRSDNKELLKATPVRELRERVYQVFGSQTLDELVDLGSRETRLPPASGETEERAYRVSGFISRPQIQKPNRNSIFLFVNRRLIRDRLLLHALSSAYHNLMPAGAFPFALLFLDCDCEEVDVNVHPSKTEVRFRSQSFVHDFVRDVIREVLIETKPVSSMPMPAQAQPAAALPYSEFSQRMENQAWPELPAAEFTLRPAEPAPTAGWLDLAAPAKAPLPEAHGVFPAEAIEQAASSLTALSDLRPMGQLHDSFIVAAGRDGLWLIDQHVAHERILFESVLKQRASGRVESQRLLMPIIVQLTPAQQIEYTRIADELNTSGFETEPFGNRTIALKAAPAAVPPAEISKLVLEILETSERELRRASLDDARRAIAASIACRAAIKINTPLDATKMEWLLRNLAGTDCPMSCPHGRPIALRYSLRDILKSFQRI